MDDEQEKQRDMGRYHTLALVLGYNELAKREEALESKLYCRMVRNHFEVEHAKLGGYIKRTEDDTIGIIEMPEGPPHIQLREADIELMRSLVARHDAARASEVSP